MTVLQNLVTDAAEFYCVTLTDFILSVRGGWLNNRSTSRGFVMKLNQQKLNIITFVKVEKSI